MRIPQIFVPERDLETTVQDYLKDRSIPHKDPNITYIMSVLGTTRLRDRTISENFAKAYKQLVKTAKECSCAVNFLETLEQIASELHIPHHPTLETIREAEKIYDQKVKEDITQAYLGDTLVIEQGVMNYVLMIVGMSAEFRQSNYWSYMDPRTKQLKSIVIDKKYIQSVEERLGLRNQRQKEQFRIEIIKIYAMKVSTDPWYDFMDNTELVKAVTDVKLQLDIAGAGSLIGALANKTDEENKQAYNRMTKTMINKQDYCKICAEKTIEYFCAYKG